MKLNLSLFKLLLVLSLITVGLTACGKRSGSEFQYDKPVISIVSNEGKDVTDSLSVLNGDLPHFFQQAIYWNAYSKNGIIDGVSYRLGRVTEVDGDYITNWVGGATGDKPIDNDGWYYHYLPGADVEIPLDNPYALRDIWTKDTHVIMNLPANVILESDTTDTVVDVKNFYASVFEIRCKDDQGNYSDIVRKYYQVKSADTSVLIAASGDAFKDSDPSADIADLSNVGRGLTFKFTMQGKVPYVETSPYSFFYRVADIHFPEDADTCGVVSDSLYDYPLNGDWSTVENEGWQETAHLEKVDEVTLYTKDIEGPDDEFKKLHVDRYNLVEVKVMDQSAHISKIFYKIIFVSSKFNPACLIYKNFSPAIGRYHYTNNQPGYIDNETFPIQTILNREQVATPFYTDSNGRHTAIYSDDMRIFMNWGYKGEYLNNYRAAKKSSKVLDRDTNENYLSEIKYYEIRFNDDFYVYPKLTFSGSEEFIKSYPNADSTDFVRWLRVPVGNEIAQKIVLTGDALHFGLYDSEEAHNTLEVRTIDLQGVPSYTEVFDFYLYNITSEADKKDILIIDDTCPTRFYLEAGTDQFYDNLISGLKFGEGDNEHAPSFDTIDYIDSFSQYEYFHEENNIIAPTDLMRYKMVFYHCDNPALVGSYGFANEIENFETFFRLGGNIIFAGSQYSLPLIQKLVSPYPENFLAEAFGLNSDPSSASKIVSSEVSILSKPYMTGARDFDIDAGNDMNVELENPINSLITRKGGIGAFAYLNERSALNSNASYVSHTLVCKNWDPDSNDGAVGQRPSEEVYTEINDKVVGFGGFTLEYGAHNKGHMFTFPLSYMKLDEARAAVKPIIADMLNQ